MSIIVFIVGVVYVIACLFLILVVLLQSGKGGGLSGFLGGASDNPLTDTLGSTGAEKTLNKWTAVAAAGFFIMALLLTVMGGKLIRKRTLSEELTSGAAAPAAAPELPAPAPGEGPAPEAGEAAPENELGLQEAPEAMDVSEEIPVEEDKEESEETPAGTDEE